MRARHVRAVVVGLLLAAACRADTGTPAALGAPTPVAPGADLYRTTDRALVENAGPIAVFLLKLDPTRIRLVSALSKGKVLEAEPVEGIARRLGAVAAVNGGYFNRANGEPTGLLKVGGELVSDTRTPRGVVLLRESPEGRTELVFDRLTARVTLMFTSDGLPVTVPVAGVDTTRARGRLMLYTPTYHPDTDTAPAGTEWVLDGDPLRVVDVRGNLGRTPIPPTGVVLSFGGVDLPEPLDRLVEGVTVEFETTWTSAEGLEPAVIDGTSDIVAGAGLLRRDGRVVTDWQEEALDTEAFTAARHPRTLIGVDREGFIWLAVVDGRQPDHSVGMTFGDLQRLCDYLDLTNALNLDGGGSTTMVANGGVVNRPSDPTGPRPVSDAIVVMAR
jgi:hypothetical protein